MTTTIAKAKLDKLGTAELIVQYDLAIGDHGKRHNQNGPTRLQERINYIVDLLDGRADANDPDALAWFATERTQS